MKEYRGAVFFDVDGTLIDERSNIFQPTPTTVEAIKCLKKNGYLVGIATGRAHCYIPDMGIDFDCYVGCNGAVAEVDGQEIFNDYIPEAALLELIAFMEQEGIGFDLEMRDICYVEKSTQEKFYNFLKRFDIGFDCFKLLEDRRGIMVNKLVISFDELGQLHRMQEAFQGRFAILQHHQNLSADVGKLHMSKAVGVKAVIEKLGLDLNQTYAFGDDCNDIEMLQTVGCGIAMTPHAEALEQVADYMTGSVAEEGIYYGLRHFGLI